MVSSGGLPILHFFKFVLGFAFGPVKAILPELTSQAEATEILDS
jgi:hypothetical protein